MGHPRFCGRFHGRCGQADFRAGAFGFGCFAASGHLHLLAIWSCHGLVPHPVLVYAVFRSNVMGDTPPVARCLRRLV